jgi:pimeloyl-ACP methyl ester carboxylesterase
VVPAAAPDLEPRPFEAVASGGNVLRGEASGAGPVVVQAHGITAARKYVTHGSRVLQRHGFTAVPYDARGHGQSDPAPAGEAYEYAALASDMGAVVEAQSPGDRVVIAGHSMGAHTGAAYALANPDRVAGLVAIGPASRGAPASAKSIAYWDRLADGLERGGVDGFVEAYDDGTHDARWRDVVLRLARQRLELHRDPNAVAAALRSTTRSVPFDGLDALEALAVPTLVVASHDTADPGHPYAVAEEWSERIPGARIVSEAEGESPLAWQGGKLSREIAAFCEEPAVAERLQPRVIDPGGR